MQGFFHNNVCTTEHGDLPEKGKRTCRNRRYVPQKNSVAYALLITLYRGTANGSEFMRKQELIDAAEASGFSRVPIAPEKGKGKPGNFGSSSREWYSGWSCMKTLIAKGLVVKSSSPAKHDPYALGFSFIHIKKKMSAWYISQNKILDQWIK
ncbi:Crossover junction endonuclease mus81 [Dionaea muscipula]